MYSPTLQSPKTWNFSARMRSLIVVLASLSVSAVVQCEDLKVFSSTRSDYKVVRLSQPVVPLKTRTQVDIRATSWIGHLPSILWVQILLLLIPKLQDYSICFRFLCKEIKSTYFMTFNTESTVIHWTLEDKQKVKLFVKTHNQHVKPVGLGVNTEVRKKLPGSHPVLSCPDPLVFRIFSLPTTGTVFV